MNRNEILQRFEILMDENFADRLEQLRDIPGMTIGEYFANVLAEESSTPPSEYAAVKRNAETTIHDFFLKVVTMRDPVAEEDFGWLEQISRIDENLFDDLRSVYEVAATAPPSPQRAPAQVFFHLLDREGEKVEESIEVDSFHKKVELGDWFTIDGKGHLVQRIAFDHNRLDVFLQRIALPH